MNVAVPSTPDLIRERLAAFEPVRVDIQDDSERHRGHAGAKEGGHFRLTIVSTAFEGQSTLARHRLVHSALADLMQRGIHALSVVAVTPTEFHS